MKPSAPLRRAATTSALLLIPFSLMAQEEHPVIKLWPNGAPDEPESFNAEEVRASTEDTEERIAFVDDPTITLYKAPADKANGAGVIVCPGGGYNILAWPKEGTEIAEWFNSIGVTAAVLKYRVPRRDKEEPWPWPLQDAQRAIRLMRQNAEDWGVDPNRVGVLGFSAGGHLTYMTGTHYDEQRYEKVDAADDLSARPDFIMPIYAAYLSPNESGEGLSPELKLTSDTPPVFTAVTQNDSSRAVDAAKVFVELKKLEVPAEAHLFTHGRHGYGMRPNEDNDPVLGWPDRLEDWLTRMGLLED